MIWSLQKRLYIALCLHQHGRQEWAAHPTVAFRFHSLQMIFFFPQQLAHVFMRRSFVQKAVLLKMLNLLVGVFENSGLGRCREDCSQHSNTVLFTWTDMELQDLCFRIVYRVDVAWGNKQRSSQYVLILLENEWWGIILFFSILAEIEESSVMACTGRLILWLPLFFFPL